MSITRLTEVQRKALRDKSVAVLPNDPSAYNLKSPTVKPKFYGWGIDASNSLFALIDGVIEEANTDIALKQDKAISIDIDEVATETTVENELQLLQTAVETNEDNITTNTTNIDTLQSQMATAISDIDNIEDGTTVVNKALNDKDGNAIDTTYLKKNISILTTLSSLSDSDYIVIGEGSTATKITVGTLRSFMYATNGIFNTVKLEVNEALTTDEEYLATVESPIEYTLYFVPSQLSDTSNNEYNVYMWVVDEWESIDRTIDLSGYTLKDDYDKVVLDEEATLNENLIALGDYILTNEIQSMQIAKYTNYTLMGLISSATEVQLYGGNNIYKYSVANGLVKLGGVYTTDILDYENETVGMQTLYDGLVLLGYAEELHTMTLAFALASNDFPNKFYELVYQFEYGGEEYTFKAYKTGTNNITIFAEGKIWQMTGYTETPLVINLTEYCNTYINDIYLADSLTALEHQSDQSIIIPLVTITSDGLQSKEDKDTFDKVMAGTTKVPSATAADTATTASYMSIGKVISTLNAGENLASGDVIYISDGSDGLTAGRWYKANTNTRKILIGNCLAISPAVYSSGAIMNAILEANNLTNTAFNIADKSWYLQGSISGNYFVSDGNIIDYANLAVSKTYMRVGYSRAANTIYMDGNNDIISLDADKNITYYNGIKLSYDDWIDDDV